MATQAQIYEVIHSSPEIKTVGQYVRDLSSPAFGYNNNIDAFLAVKQLDGRTNKEVIFASYTTASQRRLNEKKASSDYTLKVGTRLAVEMSKISRGGLLTEGIEVVSNNIPAFKAQALADLESREGYRILDTMNPISGQAYQGITKDYYPDMTVWIWSKALSDPLDPSFLNDSTRPLIDAYQGQIFNITPFVQKVTTSMTKGCGGNFSITLPPLLCELDENRKWIIKKQHLTGYTQNTDLSLQKDGYVAEGSLYSLNNADPAVNSSVDSIERNTFLFHTILGTNDLVFIRFETLEMEKDQRVSDAQNFNIDKSKLAGRIYDMIGLIDINQIKVTPEGSDVLIDISGRDLSKLFIEDGAYFYPIEFTGGKLYLAGGATNSNSAMQRVNSENALYYLGLYFNNSIERIFKFVIQQLSTIKICPDALFDAWGDRRNTRFNPEKKQVGQFKTYSAQITQLENQAKSAIKTTRSQNGISLIDPLEENLKIDQIFQEQKRFLQEIRNQKVRKVDGNLTAGWLPFAYPNDRGLLEAVGEDVFPAFFNANLYQVFETREVQSLGATSIVVPIDQIIDLETAKPDYKLQAQEELASGIWQIIKLVIDEGITGRRLIDSSISTASGSLLSFFQKVCQEPFVEFYMDTYGDMYHLIARKPPHDRKGYLSLLQGSVTTEIKGQERVVPAVVTITADDVTHESLGFEDSEAISWYHLNPRANLFGKAEELAMAYFPAIYFPEYSEVWGSRPMQLFHNYLPNTALDPETSDNLDVIEKQMVEDLRYMIESTAYLPFTRKGAIVLNGDRRLKVGNLIRYAPTGEVFFVTAVQQTWMVTDTGTERSTTIHVERGMVEQFIYGWPGSAGVDNSTKNGTDTGTASSNMFYSYFNIIQTVPNYSYTTREDTITEKVRVGTKYPDAATGSSPTVLTLPTGVVSVGEGSSLIEQGNFHTELLDTYGPNQRSIFVQFINAINATGYWVDITSAKRSYEEQLALWKQNSKNAKPGHSRHETGLAIDINVINKTTRVRLKKNSSYADWIASGIPFIAKSLNLKWAGGEGQFGSYIDRVHFEIADTNTSGAGEPIYEEQKKVVKKRVLNRDSLFSNFKVNKQVFDFFMRRQQMAQSFSKVRSTYIWVDPNDDRDLGGVTVTPQ